MKNNLAKELFKAVKERDVEKVRVILAKGVDPDVRDSRGRTPLMIAAYFGYPDIARILLEKGADVNARDNKGRTPLRWAYIGMKKMGK
jgi:ankyrin repeat protein